MARRARGRGRTLSRRHPESPHLSLAGPERRAYFQRAGICVAIALMPAAINLRPPFAPADVAWALGWAALMVVIAGYHVRVAYGWVHIDPVGLRTSRLWRGRRLRWAEIDILEAKTWGDWGAGRWWLHRYGSVTLVKVRTFSGRSYYLPAPRTTSEGTAEAFQRQLRQLMRHVPGY
ncbi:hypothetical protein ODJ79_29935 [Actinoplanes sp. KI2]|uniref:hypothetical protein n=1 Tax=Actinoplanes sp. KI2 TaxID=2983315 RepID=UPI0021D5E3CE|nr:hypothetical protein [Actinoplanes sp. KI2]MCU7727959.1 hypothetical protein [Actinoplanes sp. KI2]